MIFFKDQDEIGGMVAQFVWLATNWESLYRTKGSDSIITKGECEVLAGYALNAEKIVSRLKLNSVQRRVLALSAIGNSNTARAFDAVHAIKELREAIIYALEDMKFIRVTEDMQSYMDKKSPFGAAVTKAFPKCSEDIDEAHKCFAFSRYTASMFHLGRAMELATASLAKKMRVGVPDDDWQGLLKAINKAVDAMPYATKAQREKRAPFAEAAGFSFQFKEAWRNPTAHPKRTYTRQEALDVINGARAFMDSVARKIFKAKSV